MKDLNYELPEPPEHDEEFVVTGDGKSVAVAEPVLFEDAGDGVKPFFWKNIQLAPFAIDREGDWKLHRELLGAPPLDEVIRSPHAILPDALRVLFFCAHAPSSWIGLPTMKEQDGRWIRINGHEQAMMLEMMIREWAGEQILRQDGAAAVNLFYDIFNSSQSTRAIALNT